MPETESPRDSSGVLAEPDLRRALERFVRRRMPVSEAEDVVQTVLVEALASERRPDDPAEVRRWVMGIARHKVADFHRRGRREQPEELPDIEDSPAPVEAREMVRWAEQQAQSTRGADQTLEWMAREGEGEKLETIAAEADLPPARVRQRVSRMRRWMRERWLAELAAVAALGVLLFVAWRLVRTPDVGEIADTEVRPEASSPVGRAIALRSEAFALCDDDAFEACLQRLDEAKALDPKGDGAVRVGAARARATAALKEAQTNEDSKVTPVVPTAPTADTTAQPTADPTAPPPYVPPTPKKPAPPEPRFQDNKQNMESDRKKAPLPLESNPAPAKQEKGPGKPMPEPEPQQQQMQEPPDFK